MSSKSVWIKERWATKGRNQQPWSPTSMRWSCWMVLKTAPCNDLGLRHCKLGWRSLDPLLSGPQSWRTFCFLWQSEFIEDNHHWGWEQQCLGWMPWQQQRGKTWRCGRITSTRSICQWGVTAMIASWQWAVIDQGGDRCVQLHTVWALTWQVHLNRVWINWLVTQGTSWLDATPFQCHKE